MDQPGQRSVSMINSRIVAWFRRPGSLLAAGVFAAGMGISAGSGWSDDNRPPPAPMAETPDGEPLPLPGAPTSAVVKKPALSIAPVVPQVVQPEAQTGSPQTVEPGTAIPVAWKRQVGEQTLIVPGLIDEQLRSADDSLARGLMPLDDYYVQWQAAVSTGRELSRLTENPEWYGRLLTRQIAQLRTVRRDLVDLNQPAATRSELDQMIAELWQRSLARDLQALRDPKRKPSPSAADRDLAQKAWDLQSYEYSEGRGSLTQLSNVLEWNVATASEGTRRQVESRYFELLDRSLQGREDFGAAGAGLGRADLVELARFERKRAEIELSTDSLERKGRLVASALASADRAFEEQIEFYNTGTASLFDVASTWDAGARLSQRWERTTGKIDSARLAARDEQFGRLERLAGEVDDLRGRNSADVAMVRTLSARNQLWALDRERPRLAADAGGTADVPQTR